jgi:hypothetical protein
MGLNPCANTAGPTQDCLEGGPHRRDEGGRRAVVEGVRDGVLLLHGQEQDMRNHFGH